MVTGKPFGSEHAMTFSHTTKQFENVSMDNAHVTIMTISTWEILKHNVNLSFLNQHNLQTHEQKANKSFIHCITNHSINLTT